MPVAVSKSFVQLTHLILKATHSGRWTIIMHEKTNTEIKLGDLTTGREFEPRHTGHKNQSLKHYTTVSWLVIDNTSKYLLK